MAEEIIVEIRAAESHAEELLQEAQVEARRIVEEARTKGENLVKEAQTRARSQAEDIIARAVAVAEKEIVPPGQKRAEEMHSLQQVAASRMAAAVAMIAERIVKSDGHS